MNKLKDLFIPAGPVTAFRLDGDYHHKRPVSSSDVLRSSKILAFHVATDEQVAQILETLIPADTYGGEGMRCFIPRFGLTFGSGEDALDVLICIECYWAYFFRGETKRYEAISELGRKRFIALYLELFPGHEPEPNQPQEPS